MLSSEFFHECLKVLGVLFGTGYPESLIPIPAATLTALFVTDSLAVRCSLMSVLGRQHVRSTRRRLNDIASLRPLK